MIKCWIGIDPGLTGAMAVITSDDVVNTVMSPLAGKTLDLAKVRDLLKVWSNASSTKIVIEKVHSMPGQGVASTFTFGKAAGQVEGVVAGLGLSYQLVAPQTWKKVILADTEKDKLAAIDYCRRIYPNVDLLPTPRSKKPNPNMADALCIATYCRMLWP